MSISEMKIFSIIGMMSNLDQVIEICGKSEGFQPDNAPSFYVDNENVKKFAVVDDKNPFDKYLKIFKNIAKEIDLELKFTDIKKLKINNEEVKGFINYFENNLVPLLKKQDEVLKKIELRKKILKKISNFEKVPFDPKRVKDCQYLKGKFGSLPIENFKKTEESENPYVLFFPLKTDKKYCWGVYFCPEENLEEVDNIFKNFGFEELEKDILEESYSFSEKIYEIQKIIEKFEEEILKIKRQMLSFVEENKEKILKFYTRLSELKVFFDIKKSAFKYNDSFIIVGWVLEEKSENLKKKLENIQGVEVSVENAKEAKNHEAPVRLKNKPFFRPFESLVSMYGIPKYNGFDPTALFSITYTLIFGMMFGDLGQGIVLAFLGHFLYKYKKAEVYKILVYCGFSSSFFGLVYGSFFGFENALDFIYKMLGFHEKPIEVLNGDIASKLLVATVGFGSLLVITSILINIFYSFRQKNLSEAILSRNGVMGLVFYSSLIIGIFTYFIFKIQIFSSLFIAFFIVFPVICMFLHKPIEVLIFKKGTLKDLSWGSYVVEGIIEILFETILSYVSNTMSFVRIGIFVLVHSGMMLVVLKLGEMVQHMPLLYCFIVIIGNIIVMGMEAVFVAIQTLRLEFFEMFSRFFTEQGKKFEPVSINS